MPVEIHKPCESSGFGSLGRAMRPVCRQGVIEEISAGGEWAWGRIGLWGRPGATASFLQHRLRQGHFRRWKGQNRGPLAQCTVQG